MKLPLFHSFQLYTQFRK